jgi:hypothetical protein
LREPYFLSQKNLSQRRKVRKGIAAVAFRTDHLAYRRLISVF